jgi:hypothetical protein
LGVATLLELGSSAPFAEVVSLSQLAQKKPVKARAIFLQCLYSMDFSFLIPLSKRRIYINVYYPATWGQNCVITGDGFCLFGLIFSIFLQNFLLNHLPK